ncbi:MAG: hypothetical protein JO165_01080, partial [Candidatus Eremiobacteraeota bacterium]|nr:hypothetical protein [Candidatus Eremiobacteraeota bacterium]
RAFITVGLSLFVFVLLASLIFTAPPLNYTGVSRGDAPPLTANVVTVASGSPAYRAGLRTGDVVSCLSTRDRELLFPRFGFNAYAPGVVVHLCATRSGATQQIAFQPAAKPTLGLLYFNVPYTVLRLAVFLIFLLTGIALVLARPTLLTWLFYVYCLSSGPYYALATYGTMWPSSLYSPTFLFEITLTTLGVVCLALFALCVPNDGIPRGWRRTVFLAISITAIVPLAYSLAFILWTAVNVPYRMFVQIDEVFTGIAVLVVIARLFEVRGEERARLAWVAFALAWGVITNDIRNNVGAWGTVLNNLSTGAAYLTIVMPIVIVYAILKRHIIDVRFVISRTVVYACLTTLVVAVIGIVDWATSAYLSQVRLAMAIDAGVTIGLAFVLHRTYRWIESAVDFMLFRRKHEAERYLDRVSHTLTFAEHEEAVDKALVHDPYDKLRLTASALFRATREGAYDVMRVEGWTALAGPRFSSDDDLVRFMIAERTKIDVADLRAHVAEPFCAQGHIPAIAIPIFQGNLLTGFMVYGIHRDGTQLDPDEIETLERLCASAAQAYTGIELARYQGAGVILSPVPISS